MVCFGWRKLAETAIQTDEKMQKKVRKSSKVNKPMLRTESVHSNSITTMSVVTSATRTKEHTDQQQFIEWYVFFFGFQ